MSSFHFLSLKLGNICAGCLGINLFMKMRSTWGPIVSTGTFSLPSQLAKNLFISLSKRSPQICVKVGMLKNALSLDFVHLLLHARRSFLVTILQIVLPDNFFFGFFLFQIFKKYFCQRRHHFCDTLLVLTTSCLQIVALDHVLQIFVPVDFFCKMSFRLFLCKLSLWIVFCGKFVVSWFCLVSFSTTFLQTSFQ